MLATPEGETMIELVKFHSPADKNGIQYPGSNTLGIRHIAFAVEDIEAIVADVKKRRAQCLLVKYKTIKICINCVTYADQKVSF